MRKDRRARCMPLLALAWLWLGAGCNLPFGKQPVMVRVHEAFGDRGGYHVAGTLLDEAGRPVVRPGPVKLDVTLASVRRTVPTDAAGRFELDVTAADFHRDELPGGDADLLFRLAPGEERRCGLRLADGDAQREIVTFTDSSARWAIVVILHDLPMLDGGRGWLAPAAPAADGGGPDSPGRIGRLLRFLRREAGVSPPAVYYVLMRPGPDCRQVRSFLDVRRLPGGGIIARAPGEAAARTEQGADPFLAASLVLLNRRIGGVRWVVLGRLGTGDAPGLFEAKAALGLRLAGGYLLAEPSEPWPAGLQELILLTAIKRADAAGPLASDLQEAGWLPVEAIARARELTW